MFQIAGRCPHPLAVRKKTDGRVEIIEFFAVLALAPLARPAAKGHEGQTSTVAKLAPLHTTVHKLSHQPLNLCSCTSLGRRQLGFCGYANTSALMLHSNGCVSQTRTFWSGRHSTVSSARLIAPIN